MDNMKLQAEILSVHSKNSFAKAATMTIRLTYKHVRLWFKAFQDKMHVKVF